MFSFRPRLSVRDEASSILVIFLTSSDSSDSKKCRRAASSAGLCSNEVCKRKKKSALSNPQLSLFSHLQLRQIRENAVWKRRYIILLQINSVREYNESSTAPSSALPYSVRLKRFEKMPAGSVFSRFSTRESLQGES